MRCIMLLLIIVMPGFADPLNDWVNPKWGMTIKELNPNYQLETINIVNMKKNIKEYLGNDISKRISLYVVDPKKMFEYKDMKFHVFLGFLDNYLVFVVLTTDEINRNEKSEHDVIHQYTELFNLKENVSWRLGRNIVDEYSFIGSKNTKDEYIEMQIPRNNRYLQFTLYRFSKQFIDNLKIKSVSDRVNSVEIFTRVTPN